MIYTIGHSSHPIERFLGLLRRRIVALVDVRSRPYSKHAPWFQKRPLERALAGAEIDYLFLGDELGGYDLAPEDYARRATEEGFLRGVERLVALARERATAIMCAEEDPRRCHRHLLIAPALRERGIQVVHIRGDGRLEAEAGLRGAQLGLFD